MRENEKTINRSAAVALGLIVNEQSSAELLLIKKSKRKNNPWSAHIAFPGGWYDKEDKNIKNTCIREVYEEIGLDLRQYKNIPMDRVKTHLGNWVYPFIFLMKKKPEIKNINKNEVEKVLYLSLEEFKKRKKVLKQPQNQREKNKKHKNKHIKIDQMAAFKLQEGLVLWGLSYKITKAFMKNHAQNLMDEKI